MKLESSQNIAKMVAFLCQRIGLGTEAHFSCQGPDFLIVYGFRGYIRKPISEKPISAARADCGLISYEFPVWLCNAALLPCCIPAVWVATWLFGWIGQVGPTWPTWIQVVNWDPPPPFPSRCKTAPISYHKLKLDQLLKWLNWVYMGFGGCLNSQMGISVQYDM